MTTGAHNMPAGLANSVCAVEKFGPISAEDLMEILGKKRTRVDRLVRDMKKMGLIHVSGYRVIPGKKFRSVKVYSYGAGKDVARPRPSRHRPSLTPEKVAGASLEIPEMDEFTKLFFGGGVK